MNNTETNIVFKQSYIGVGLLALLSVMLGFYFAFAHGDEVHDEIETSGGSSYPVVTVMKPTPAHLDSTGFEVSGVVHAANQTEVYPLKSGNITHLNVNTGDYVDKGQILARITPEKSDSQIGSEIKLLRQEINLLNAKKQIMQENADTKIALSQEIAAQRKELLINNQDKITRDKNEKILPLQQSIENKMLEIDTAKKNYENEIGRIEKEKELIARQSERQNQNNDKNMNEVLDAMTEFLYTDPHRLRTINNGSSIERYIRPELKRALPRGINTFNMEFLAFYKTFSDPELEKNSEDLLFWAEKIRNLSRTYQETSKSNNENETIKDLRVALDEAVDHYTENAQATWQAVAKIDSLNAEIITAGLDLASKEIQLMAEIENIKTQINAEDQSIGLDVLVEGKSVDVEAKIKQKEQENEKLLSEKDIEQEIKQKEVEIAAKQEQWGWGTVIRAPFSGSITARHVSVGTSVNTGKPLFSLVDENKKFVRFYISEDQYPFVKEGKIVTFASQFAPSESFNAPISRISKSLSEDTKQILVEADITDRDDLDRVIANMSVRVQVPLFAEEPTDPHDHEEGEEDHTDEDEVSLYAIPELALQLSENSQRVWIVNDQVQAEAKTIETEFFFDGTAYVSSGLTDKEWIIIKSPVELSEGLEIDTKVFSNDK